MVNAKHEAIALLKDTLRELESPKGSVSSGVQKLLRVARILKEEKIINWCDFQLGKKDYTEPLEKYIEILITNENNNSKKAQDEIYKAKKTLLDAGIKVGFHFDEDDVNFLLDKAGGGCASIAFIEDRYTDLIKNKQANDGKYYKANLSQRIAHVKRKAHEKADFLFNKIAFTDAIKTSFDFLKEEVDDKLLDLNPELSERLMIAFKSVSSENPEEWSHALTSCRRLIEGLADELFPPLENDINGRKLGKQQYINRLWAFMDKAIESDSNKAVAKAHVDFLGFYLEKIHKVNNKGVHASITKVEAIKTVFHTYLLIADILGYLTQGVVQKETSINIHTATLDELESVLGVNRTIAKEIIKMRVKYDVLTPQLLASIRGVGLKTIAKAEELFSFNPIE